MEMNCIQKWLMKYAFEVVDDLEKLSDFLGSVEGCLQFGMGRRSTH